MSSTVPVTGHRPTAPVVPLRPRVVARRVADLRRRLTERGTAEPHHGRLLTIITEVLDRSDDVPAADLDLWERYLRLLEEHSRSANATAACAATANLVGLGLFGAPRDYLALVELADVLGHARLARIQHRYGVPLEAHPGLQLTTEALRRMVTAGLGERLARHPLTASRAAEIENACLRAAHALLLQGIDRDWSVPVLDSVEELVDIAVNGTIVEWRHHMALVTASAWTPYTDRLVEIAAETGHPHAVAVIAAIVDLCREHPGAAPPRWAPSPTARHAAERAAALVAERRCRREHAARRGRLRPVPDGPPRGG